MTQSKPVMGSSAADIIAVLVDVPRATMAKIAEDTGRNIAGLHRNLSLLLRKQLIEEAGKVRICGTRRTAMTYRLHPRLRKEP